MRVIILTFLLVLYPARGRSQSDNRLSRQQRILSILESYRPEPSQSPLLAARYQFSPGSSGVASDGVGLTHYSSGWGGGTEPPDRTPPPSTVEPPESPYDLWYYQDDSNYVQGPFSSPTMLEWQKAGYFRQGLLLRREVDNIFSNLATYTALYGRSPFSKGSYPGAIIVRTTPLTSSSTTSTTTTTTTSSTARPPNTTEPSYRPHFSWDYIESNHLQPVRGDGIEIEEDYSDQEYQTESEEEDIEEEQATREPRSGDLRLTGGHDESEGNLLVFHDGQWGGVCDDEWDEYDARVACKQLGYPGSVGITNGGLFGYTPSQIWMDNIYCYGTEERLEDCRFEGWGVHDCDRTEAAGVRCKPHPPSTTTTTTTTPAPKVPIVSAAERMEVRLAGGRTEREGRVEMRFDEGRWGVACGDGWGVREAIVTCRQLGLGYVSQYLETARYGGSHQPRVISGLSCRGDEEALIECQHDMLGEVFCPGEGNTDIAAVVCTDKQADLEPDIYQLVTSAYLEDRPLVLLQCAMEENCLASGAYTERQENPYWQQVTRRLLRFTTAISNIGNADFRPFIPKESWQWHACHQVTPSLSGNVIHRDVSALSLHGDILTL